MCLQIHREAKRILMLNRQIESSITDKNFAFIFQYAVIFYITLFALPLAIVIKLLSLISTLLCVLWRKARFSNTCPR